MRSSITAHDMTAHDSEHDAKSRSYAWVITVNNYTDDDIRSMDTIQAERVICGKEVAPTTGTPHL